MHTALEDQLLGEVTISLEHVRLRAEFVLPTASHGVVVFAHAGDGSGRSPRNRQVAQQLRGKRLGTLLFDLLAPEEQYAERHTRHLTVDIDLLAERVLAAIDWVGGRSEARSLPIGVLGFGTGSAAALVAAAQRPRETAAVVCRGGRADLAGAWLAHVRAATLLLVGGSDPAVLEPNLSAYDQLTCIKTLKSIPGASPSFKEPGVTAAVAELSADWFADYFAAHWSADAAYYSSML